MKEGLTGLVLSDFHTGNLESLFNRDTRAPQVRVQSTPFGQVVQTLVGQGAGVGPSEARPDFALVWTRAEAVVPSFRAVLAFEPFEEEVVLREVDQFAAQLEGFVERVHPVFVTTWTRDVKDRGLGMLDLSHPQGPGRILRRMNERLIERVSGVPGLHVLDAGRWLAEAGSTASDPRLWYLAKIPYSNEVFQGAIRDVKAGLRALRGEARKLVIVDLDDTLWGGIVGETGPEGLRLGGHDPVGEAFVDFQRALKSLARRGIVLGIASKNDEEVAMRAIRGHPDMVLRPEDFAGWRINWQDKAANVLELTKELNLGLQSVVFIDDNPAERGRVREALPEVLVPDWPDDPLRYAETLRAMDAFDQAQISAEDRSRGQAYQAERARRTLLDEAPSLEAWLESLKLTVEATPVDGASVQRVVQLLNKTNQMNLRTRRMSEPEFVNWLEGPGRESWSFRVRDRFSDAGLTGLVSIEVRDKVATLVDFVLSCRVFGRSVENAMLHVAAEAARAAGGLRLEARYLKTEKNAPCLSFLDDRSGMSTAGGEPRTYTWDLSESYPLPEHLELHRAHDQDL